MAGCPPDLVPVGRWGKDLKGLKRHLPPYRRELQAQGVEVWGEEVEGGKPPFGEVKRGHLGIGLEETTCGGGAGGRRWRLEETT